jgi:phosphatidyl-myo-inositol alpha-mannosyltransferase
MKVGLVCPYDIGRPGGVQDQVMRIADWLRSEGHTVGIVAPGESDDDGFVSAGKATVIPANGAATPVALAPGVSQRVVAALRQFDVVHIHEPLMPQVSLSATRLADNPLVGTFHADVSRAAGLAYTAARPITRRWLDRLDVITAVSPIAGRAVDFTGRVRIIPNGIDVAAYGSETKDPGSVVFLGRDDPRKGLDILLSAWDEVHRQQPEATLTVVGSDRPGPKPPGVVFAGRVEDGEKRAILSAASIYCAPNLGGESFGIVVAEGMAAGCAVIASAIPAFVRVLGEAGILVAPGDAVGLATAIGALLDDPGRVAALGEAARDAVVRYDGSTVAAAYTRAYEDAIASKR